MNNVFCQKRNVKFHFCSFFKNKIFPHLIQKLIHQILGLNLIQKLVQGSAPIFGLRI